MRADNATGFRNVSTNPSVVNPFKCQIVIDGQSRHLGQFATAEERRWPAFLGPEDEAEEEAAAAEETVEAEAGRPHPHTPAPAPAHAHDGG